MKKKSTSTPLNELSPCGKSRDTFDTVNCTYRKSPRNCLRIGGLATLRRRLTALAEHCQGDIDYIVVLIVIVKD